MKSPIDYATSSGWVDTFVEASHTQSLRPACQLLFIHGYDLTWAAPQLGLFLTRVSLCDDHRLALEVAAAQEKLGLSALYRRVLPSFLQMFVAFVRESGLDLFSADKDDLAAKFSARFATSFHQNAGPMKRLLPLLIEHFDLGITAAARRAVASLRGLRDRQLHSTGLSELEYDLMVDAMLHLKDVAHPILRFAFSSEHWDPEFTLGTGGFWSDLTDDDLNQLELIRLHPRLYGDKQGTERALALFAAAYINALHRSDSPAFPCARLGARDETEIDVLVPGLCLGMEVKVYQSPATITHSKLPGMAHDLRSQLARYFEAGCAEVLYVTNLQRQAAVEVLQIALRELRPGKTQVRAVAGLDDLLSELDAISSRLDEKWRKELEVAVRSMLRVAPPAVEELPPNEPPGGDPGIAPDVPLTEAPRRKRTKQRGQKPSKSKG